MCIRDSNNVAKLNGKVLHKNVSGISVDGHIPHIRVNGQISIGNIPHRNEASNRMQDDIAAQAEEYESSKTIPIYNYSCDILSRPFTWKEFMKLNEDQEPLMPSGQSVSY